MINDPIKVAIRDHMLEYKFGNLKLAAEAERLGFGESFKSAWMRMIQPNGEQQYQKLKEKWVAFLELVLVSVPEEIKDIEQLTAGEVLEIVGGFTRTSMEIR